MTENDDVDDDRTTPAAAAAARSLLLLSVMPCYITLRIDLLWYNNVNRK